MRHAEWALFVVVLALLVVGGLAGCTVGPNFARPAVVPAQWRSPAEAVGSLADLGWWQLFRDPVLQGLIRTAFTENTDLRIAVARVAEARAQLGITRAAQFPQVDGQASYTTQRFSRNSFLLNAMPAGAGVPWPPRGPGGARPPVFA